VRRQPRDDAVVIRVADEVRLWDRECRDGVSLQITAYRKGTGPETEPRFTVPKRHTRLAIEVVSDEIGLA